MALLELVVCDFSGDCDAEINVINMDKVIYCAPVDWQSRQRRIIPGLDYTVINVENFPEGSSCPSCFTVPYSLKELTKWAEIPNVAEVYHDLAKERRLMILDYWDGQDEEEEEKQRQKGV
jgi:hypothetical protein|tara:strand:- start:4684 stop:5043 length:360 start_codon:yes stop_codon:yes gene_type:complete